jgi:hypothetical protein
MASHFRLGKYQLLPDTSVSDTTVYTSDTVHILNLDNVYLQMNVSGTPVGTAVIQVSGDHVEDQEGNVQVAGNWVTVATLTVNGANIFGEDLNQLGAPWMRLVYTNSSSTGSISAFVSGKGLM